jgi:hypothetical protein
MRYAPNVVEQDPRFTDIGNLPSNFFPYSDKYIESTFTKLFIRPFTVPELRLISKAAVLKEYCHLIKAIDLCISEPINTITIGDFYYILMWLKINSMTKTPYTIDWSCPSNIVQLKADNTLIMNDDSFKLPESESDYDVIECGSNNVELVYMSDVQIICLDETNFTELPEAVGNVVFDFPRVAILESVKEIIGDPEMEFILGAAQWVKGDTLEQKIKLLEQHPNLDAFDSASALNESVIHGIEETCKLTCRRCLKQYSHKFKLDPLSFFQ